jgi:hypothetical protein
MARNVLNVTTTTAAEKLVKVTHFRNNSRTGLSDSGDSTIWSGSFTKQYDENTSWILMEGMLPGGVASSDQCGVYAGLDGMSTSNDSDRHKGVWYAGVDQGDAWAKFILYVHRIIDNTHASQELAAGSRTWSVGWKTRNGSTANKPFQIWNINSSDDGRNNQYGSIMSIYEFLY